MQETFLALVGYQHYDKFWKTTPREIFALADLKMGKARHQAQRRIMDDYIEGDS